MTSYRKRENFFEKAEREWRVEKDALVVRDADGIETRRSWQDIVSIRLRYVPTQFKTWRYVADFAFKGGATVSVDNGHFAGIAEAPD